MAKKNKTVTRSNVSGVKSKTANKSRKKKSGATVTKSRTVSTSADGKRKVTKSRSVVGKKNKENYIGGKPQKTNFSRTVVREGAGPKGKYKSRTVTKKGSRNDGTGNEAVTTKKVTRSKLPSTYKHTEKSQYATDNKRANIKGTSIRGASSSSKTRRSIKNVLGIGKWKKK
jgi:hypothetical protein